MRRTLASIRNRLDRTGIVLSGLCAAHCILGIVLVSLAGLGGGILLAPEIHEIGLALAVAIGLVTIGIGVARHKRPGPLLVGSAGLALMALALAAGHGLEEALLTIAGVALVASAHIGNLRHAC
ncbi:hypothetical protein GCM10011371_14940 [Novosphingobium marinum]|uniref:MerC mercury resistance protein n=1 Tax=Novosphingobium marinum TaxID=1514948 RepID=A0A7Y9XYV1_9SPHN|nr:MerC domain-containing protein [Novosphingobium marinum]NYH95608.1 hypothetical protein [Novosphingobium marinum]GGC28407.1 hypothetical protein GCM10011371_14940 [Novosphingobium marinum]